MGGRGGYSNSGSSGRKGGFSLPTLTGSQKQIQWATDIRGRLLEQYGKLPINPAYKDRARDIIFQNKDSSFWIENRKIYEAFGVKGLLRDYAKELNAIR